MAVESHSVTPEAHAAASAGTAPYPGKDAPKPPADEQPAAQPPADDKAPAQPSAEEESHEAPAEEPEKGSDDAAAEARKAADAAGLNYDALYEEYRSTGALSEASFKSIQSAFPGLPPEVIQTYLYGLGAAMREGEAKVYAEFGGKESVTSLIQWGAENLTPSEVAEYNAAVDRGPDAAMFALRGLQARHRAANPDAPPGEVSLVHQGKPAGGEPPIRSRRELMALQRDPRYATDPAFRESVRRKLEQALRDPTYQR